MKVAIGADKPGHHPLQAALCGSLAALSHDLFMNPMDTVKQRMQLGYYKNTLHCIRTVIRTEGPLSLYASFPTTVLMNLPYGAIMLATNESVKKILNPSDEYSVAASMTAGSVAGLVAAAFTNPLDVVKTRLQTRSLGSCPVEVPSTTPSSSASFGVSSSPSGGFSSSTIAPLSPPASSAGSAHLGSTTQKMFYSQPASLEAPVVYKVSNTIASSSGSSNSSVNNSTVIGKTSKHAYLELLQETRQVVSTIVKQEGYAGFWRGVGPRMIVHAPSVAVSWTVYEGLKHVLSNTDVSGS